MTAEVLTQEAMLGVEQPIQTMSSCAPINVILLLSLANQSQNVAIKVRKFLVTDLTLVIMPESALHELSRIHTSYPMTFMISNPEMGIKTYCGNLEFIAQEGSCNIPIWMMN